MTQPDYHAFESFAMQLVFKIIGEFDQSRPANIVTKRELSDLQTEQDLRIEDEIRLAIEQSYPSHRVVAEERGDSGPAGSEWCWYVDPIDGTCNFANELPWYSISLTLTQNDEPVAGVIGVPGTGRIYHATLGGGAYVNGRPVTTRSNSSMSGGVFLMELANHVRWSGFESLASYCEREYCTLRVMGSSALSLAHVAAGSAVGAAMPGSNPIDVGAGVLLVREAGGIVMDAAGSTSGLPVGGLVAACSSKMMDTLWELAFSR